MIAASEAIVDVLRRIGATPDKPVGMYEIGVPLVGNPYTQDDIVNGLFWLQRKGVIELKNDNRLQLVKELPSGE
ncbi:hypothetical protein [Rhizobium sp. Root482]|uniref:hypothetical protein n=1 Tax=Rhizobium sp. Root482 TaxID=1736543 RepID=UPI0006F3A896|nr:hypothetical protein [Rhizobium sp. Root482]KQY14409.1 hypothetical protein ASD31_09070 [Rhizobium sp. Root482]